MAAFSEHVTMKTEPPKSDPGMTTRFERRLTRNLASAEDLAQDTIGECRAQEARVNR